MTTIPAQPRDRLAPSEYDPRLGRVPHPLLLALRSEGVPIGLKRRAQMREAKRGYVRKETAA